MKVVVKVNLGEDNRRITFEEKPSFNALYQLVKNLFGPKGDFSIKYVDDEEDLISLTCDREIEEAWSYAVNSKTQVLKIRVGLDENGAKPQAVLIKNNEDSNIKAKKAQNNNNVSDTLNDAVHQATETFNTVVDKIMAEIKNLQTKTTDVKQIVNTIQTSTLKDLIHHFQGLLQWLIKGLLFQMLSPNNNKNSKHNLIGTIIKLIPVLTSLGVENIFTQFLPILTSIFNPGPKSEIHNAVCDACNHYIIGVRYKCSICPNFDLCEKCEPKCQQLHNPNHPFLKVHNRVQANILNNNASNNNSNNNNNVESDEEEEEEKDEKEKRREERDRRREERRKRESEKRREDRDKAREEKRKRKEAVKKEGVC